MAVGITFAGSQLFYGTYTGSRGINPGVAAVVTLPSDRPALSIGDLRFEDGNGSWVDLPDCLPSTPFIRKAFPNADPRQLPWRWDVTILDHRWRWQFGSISGEYNKRLPDGTVDPTYKKTPTELANLCLTAMGEAGYDATLMPSGVYPYVNWNNTNPALALWDLCDRVACEVTGGEFAQVKIYQRGSGQDLPTGGNPLHQPFRFPLISRPNKLTVKCGPTVWQTKMAMDAIGRESDGTQKLVTNLSYLSGYATANPFSFSTLSGDNLSAALETVWRWFRVKGQADGSLAVPGCTDTIADVTQYFPLRDVLLDSANDLNSVKRSLPSVFEGTFWPYSDDGANVSSSARYFGPRRLIADRGIVETQQPVFGLSSGAIAAPTMYLTCTHLVRKTDGSYVNIERSQTLGGSGANLTLSRSEIFGSIKVNWSGTSQSGTSDTLGQAQTEADAYLSIFANAYPSNVEMDDEEYPGVRGLFLDGKIAQVRYSGGINRPFLTRASTFVEFDVNSVSQAERRRRNIVELRA